MNEGIKKSNNVSIITIFAIPSRLLVMHLDFLKDLDFIKCCLHVVWRTFLDFYGDICFVFKIFAQPYCREMAPSQLLDNDIPLEENFSNMDRMIATNVIIFNALIFRVMLLI